jgi:hypothetical protein
MASISSSVGLKGANQQADVRTVQSLLNQFSRQAGSRTLSVDGVAGDRTVAAIRQFQVKVAGVSSADGRVEPGGPTWQRLDGGKPPASRLSGAEWWRANEGNYPNSKETSALESPFRGKLETFIAALAAANMRVNVNSTRRNKTRAYLMHYSWKVAKGLLAPDRVPAAADCNIVWDHGNTEASRKGAQQMVDLFGLVYQPALDSRHISGRAVDMEIGWSGQAKVRDGRGQTVLLGAPGDVTNKTLHEVGASYGVVKNVDDRPHWSDDGR